MRRDDRICGSLLDARPGDIAAIDALRAGAIALVLARHAAAPLEDMAPGRFVVDVFGASIDFATPMLNGWMGVDLFFVLSGFLIAGALLRDRDAGDKARGWRAYASARFWRIAPAYLVVTAVVALGLLPAHTPSVSLIDVAYHALFLVDYVRSEISVAFWSLGVEAKFYALAPLVVWAAVRATTTRARYALLATLILIPLAARIATWSVIGAPEAYAAYFAAFRSPFHMTFDGLALGVALAFLDRDRRHGILRVSETTRRLIGVVSALCVATLLCAAPLLAVRDVIDVTIQPLAVALSFTGLTAALIWRPSPSAWMGSRGVRATARLSYALYLTHMPLIPLCLSLSALPGGRVDAASFVAAYLTLSVATALSLHVFVEAPLTRGWRGAADRLRQSAKLSPPKAAAARP